MEFVVQVQLKKPDGTTVYKTMFKRVGLFEVQNAALTVFENLKARLLPEALDNEAFRILVLKEGDVIEKFESKRWIAEGCV